MIYFISFILPGQRYGPRNTARPAKLIAATAIAICEVFAGALWAALLPGGNNRRVDVAVGVASRTRR